ncbi:MAG: rhomboid family intramembrane serine protease [Pirellulales bacterium]
MLLPYSTDAPIYHWPIITVVLIAVNLIVFVQFAATDYVGAEYYILAYGQGLHPHQWLTSNFLHDGLLHLVANMFFLWSFGLVVEGKLGWWRFLACYLGIAVLQCAGEQASMVNYDGDVPGSVGASAVISGLMAMALVWAPKNEMSCLLLLTFHPMLVDVSIVIFAVIYICLDFTLAAIDGFTVGSALLHLTGTALGFVLGVVLLKTRQVDCEGWDLFSLWRGEHGGWQRLEERWQEAEQAAEATQATTDGEALLEGIRERLARNEIAAAIAGCRYAASTSADFRLPHDDLMQIIRALLAEKKWQEVRPFMFEYIHRYPDRANRVRLNLAALLIQRESRPGRALEVLAPLARADLPPELEKVRRQLAAQARGMQQAGELELDTEE